LLDNDQAQNSQIVTDNATTDTLARALTSTTGTIARLTLGEEQANTLVEQDSLLHGETLFIITTGDLHDVTLVFFTQGISFNFLRDALIHEDVQFTFISDFDELLATSSRISDVQLLHDDKESKQSIAKQSNSKMYVFFKNKKGDKKKNLISKLSFLFTMD
jgi:hypothetical protein